MVYYQLKGSGDKKPSRTKVRENDHCAVYVKHDSRTQVVAKGRLVRRVLKLNKEKRVWLRTTLKDLKVVPISCDNHCYPHEATAIEEIIAVIAKDPVAARNRLMLVTSAPTR